MSLLTIPSPPMRPVLLLTRPRASSLAFAEALPAEMRDRVEVVISPLMEIEPLVQSLDLGAARGIVFSSANAVRAVAPLVTDRSLPCFCVGEVTAEVAREAGWDARAMGATADELVPALLREGPAGPLVHLVGQHRRGDIAGRLSQGGIETRAVPVYAQPLRDLNDAARAALAGELPVIAPLFSPRTARHFAGLARGTAPIHAVAMGEAVAESLNSLNFAYISVAEHPDAQSMVQAIGDCLGRISRVEGVRPAQ